MIDCDTFTTALGGRTDVIFWFFQHSSHNISHHHLFFVSNLFSVWLLVHHWFLSFSGHSKLLNWLCPVAQMDFSPFSSFFPHRQLFGLSVGLCFLTKVQPSQATPKAQTKSRHLKLVVLTISVTGQNCATRISC